MAQTTESDHTKPHNTTGSTSSAFESLTSKVGALLLNRVELMLLEAGSAKHTVWAGVILSLLGVLSVFMAALFALLLIILVAPESWRIGLLGGFTLFFVLFALFAFGWVRRAVRTPWFASSMGAVKEDWQTLTEQATPVQTTERRPSAQENAHE
ncbi:MAG: phage holin family protein [Burkholderiaceae bacterium]